MGLAHPLSSLSRQRSAALPDVAEIVDGFRRYELLIRASAIAFRVLLALIPFSLFTLALAGTLGLDSLWSDHLAPEISPKVSPAVFEILDTTARKVLAERQLFWMTVGFGLLLWELSAAVRAIMRSFDVIYGTDKMRPIGLRSVWLALASGLCILGSAAALQLGPLALDGPLGAIARYLIAAALLWLAVALLVRFAPQEPQPLGWVSFGTTVVVAAWLITWTVYGLYLTHIADPGSAFGAFAAIIVLLSFLQLSASVLLGGALSDALIRKAVTGDRQGK